MSQMYRHGHTGIALLAYAPIAYGLLKLNHPALALLCGIGVLAVEPLVQTLRGTPLITSTGTAIYLEELGTYDASTLAILGFCVGVFGIFVHLLGDVITIYGIRPLLPVSRWRLSLSSLRAKSRVANTAFLIFGVVAIGVVIYAAAPGVSVPQSPEHAVENATDDLNPSPVGVASAQDSNNSTSSNSVTFPNQTTNGTAVTVTNATLSRGGYVVIHSTKGYNDGKIQGSAIAVSHHLDNGTHENITIPFNHSPPGSQINITRLDHSTNLTVVLWHETTGDNRFDGLTGSGTQDTPYRIGENDSRHYIADTGAIHLNQSNESSESNTSSTANESNKSTTTTTAPTNSTSSSITIQNASVTFNDQQTNGSTLTVASVTLPDGGWVVINNQTYSSNPTGSAVGISRYLKPGKHEDVSISLLSGGVPENETLIARPSRDTNNNQQYDFVQSDGAEDNGYVNSNGEAVTDTANVTLTNAAAGLPTMSEEDQNGSNDSINVINRSTGTPATATGGGVSSTTGANGSAGGSSGSGGSGGIGGLGLLWLIPMVIVVLAILLYFYIRSQLP